PVRGELVYSVWDTSIGKFKLTQKGDSAWATFMTSTGDYRYLAGRIDTITNEFKIQNFDGVHLFYFEGSIWGDSITDGVFKSGIHYSTSWSGVRAENEKVKWSSKQEWGRGEKVVFEGVNSGGEVEFWSRERLKKSGYKLLVVDVMGTWCPNCMDEVRLLKELSLDYPEMLVVSMSFERFKGNEALRRIADFKESLGVSWEVLHGGAASKGEADSCLAFFGGG
ncbi:thioredoxin family protein, partial [Flavobacteriales bacterium]|nr:thioredoxin family protein [Flavobacteriales bacterium]